MSGSRPCCSTRVTSALITRKHAEKDPDQVDGDDNGSRFADGSYEGWGNRCAP
jgi:hypothetical protein